MGNMCSHDIRRPPSDPKQRLIWAMSVSNDFICRGARLYDSLRAQELLDDMRASNICTILHIMCQEAECEECETLNCLREILELLDRAIPLWVEYYNRPGCPNFKKERALRIMVKVRLVAKEAEDGEVVQKLREQFKSP